MGFSVNFLQNGHKSSFRMAIGILTMVIAVFWFYIHYTDNKTILWYEWVFSVNLLILGMQHLYESTGRSIIALFGKAFILIDENVIACKSSIWESETRIYWNEIESIGFAVNRVDFVRSSKNTHTIRYSKLDYQKVNELKQFLINKAAEKGIKLKNAA